MVYFKFPAFFAELLNRRAPGEQEVTTCGNICRVSGGCAAKFLKNIPASRTGSETCVGQESRLRAISLHKRHVYIILQGGRSTGEGSITAPSLPPTADVKPAVLFILSDTAKSGARGFTRQRGYSVKYRRSSSGRSWSAARR